MPGGLLGIKKDARATKMKSVNEEMEGNSAWSPCWAWVVISPPALPPTRVHNRMIKRPYDLYSISPCPIYGLYIFPKYFFKYKTFFADSRYRFGFDY